MLRAFIWEGYSMVTEESYIVAKCPKCGACVRIKRVWYPNGHNETGSFELECDSCRTHFDTFVGKDIGASFVIAGAKILHRKHATQ